ncbi:molybdenum cofactor biosysynthesis protein [Nakamurella sp. PAMC28650]|uniref:molybdenum cofactor biosysynthesis protein n=1 Tax=Nakamurella sp. PAMC28650 TaxID=2762325 RepID=UPI00164E33B2|nr:molybdenum cofactor biosysynthesis protein [Nakamurella sp. PAMC28650]QNK83306.1 molybdenum cofactor biosysynthesis protein [Nakamurella sp. PAMC28650]
MGETIDGPGAGIVQLLVSPIHRFQGRPSDGPLPAPPGELVGEIRLRAGLGIVGDRYFNKRAHRNASVTLIAEENIVPGADLQQVRRNILVRGIDVDAMVGALLSLDSGDGPVTFEVKRPANPCAWMNVTIGDGSFQAMRGRGGVRCVPLDDGLLRLGPVDVLLH